MHSCQVYDLKNLGICKVNSMKDNPLLKGQGWKFLRLASTKNEPAVYYLKYLKFVNWKLLKNGILLTRYSSLESHS